MGIRFSLGKSERLKSRKLIDQLFSEGKKFSIGTVRVFHLISEAGDKGIQFGAGAGSRSFKKAVDRNRIKRLLRESYRLQKNQLKEVMVKQNKQLLVFFLYTGKELPVFEEVFQNTGKALKKLCEMQ